MYPSSFDYKRATSVEEAIDLLQNHADSDAKLLAGGHSLLPMMKQRLANPGVVIDIGRIDSLRGISENGSTVEIGPLTTHSVLEDSELLHAQVPALPVAASTIGDMQVRNRGTIGGNLAHADPASDLPAAFLIHEGSVVVRGPDGERSINAQEFFHGMFMTDVQEDEVITRFELPKTTESSGTYRKNASPSSGYAIVGVAVLLQTEDGTIRDARVGANGILSHPFRLSAVEESLVNSKANSEVIEEASEKAGTSIDEAEVLEDLQADAEYRLQLLKVYTERALNETVSSTESL